MEDFKKQINQIMKNLKLFILTVVIFAASLIIGSLELFILSGILALVCIMLTIDKVEKNPRPYNYYQFRQFTKKERS